MTTLPKINKKHFGNDFVKKKLDHLAFRLSLGWKKLTKTNQDHKKIKQNHGMANK